jgi:hypothetical protein
LPSTDGALSFEQDIKPLFRDKDRKAMLSAFDLLDYADVSDNADAILRAVSSGQMPCDGAWPQSQVDTLQKWIDAGMPA